MKYVKIITVLLAVFTLGQTHADPGPSTTDTQDVIWFADGTPTDGKSHLTRTDNMVLVTLEAAKLKPGNVFTLWWVVFNYPEFCSGSCGEDDIFNNDGTLNQVQITTVGIAVGNATGNVVKGDGTLEFGARLPRDSNAPGHQVLFGAGFGEVMLVNSPHEAEVHLVVQSHGQRRGGPVLLEQLAYNTANCTPRCADLQAAIHPPL